MIELSEQNESLEVLGIVDELISEPLRSAKSNGEAISVAAECAANCFHDALLIVSAKRNESGSWDWRIGVNRGVVSDNAFAPQFSDLPYLQQRLTTPNGFDGFIHVRHGVGHVYKQFDHELLAAIANITSRALQ